MANRIVFQNLYILISASILSYFLFDSGIIGVVEVDGDTLELISYVALYFAIILLYIAVGYTRFFYLTYLLLCMFR